MDHWRIGAWRRMNNPQAPPKPHYFRSCRSPRFMSPHAASSLPRSRNPPRLPPGSARPLEGPLVFNSPSPAPLNSLISACMINTVSV